MIPRERRGRLAAVAGSLAAAVIATLSSQPALAGSLDSGHALRQTVRQAASSPSAAGLLQRMQEADDSAVYIAIETTRVSYPGGVATSQQRLYHAGNSASRRDYLSGPGNIAGEEIVDNGTTFWHYIPSRKTLDQGSSRLRQDRNRFRQLFLMIETGQLVATIGDQDEVAGRPCTIVELRTPGSSSRWSAFWVDNATGIHLKVGFYRSDGSFVSSTTLTEIDWATSIPATVFTAPMVPTGTQVHALPGPRRLTIPEVQAQVKFAIRQPQSLPPGYQFRAASITLFYGNQMVVLRYVSGIKTLSLFETEAPEGDPPGTIGHPSRTVSTVTVSGLKIVAVGGSQGDRDLLLASIH